MLLLSLLFYTVSSSYRPDGEVKEIRRTRDPLRQAIDYILSGNLATEEELKDIDKQVKGEIDEAVQLALSDPILPTEELYTNIFVNTPKHAVRGCDPFTWGDSELTKVAA